MKDPQRYWMYLSAPAGGIAQMVADDKGDWVNHRDYVKLQAENERLRKAGDAFLGTYLFASAKGLVTEAKAVKVIEEWTSAKEGGSK